MGGFYNVLYGYNPSCFWIMPMLGRKEEDYPRFRGCWVEEQDSGEYYIVIYTRCGGNNRDCGFGEEELYKDPLFVDTEDDDFDNTYAQYRFKVPEKWKSDFNLIIEGKIKEVSKEYKNYLRKFFPLLDKEGKLDEIFNSYKIENEDDNKKK